MGLTANEIAEVCDSTANAVGTRLAEAKKRTQASKSK